MKALVTGANGFIGKNLCVGLNRNAHVKVVEFTRNSDINSLANVVGSVDFIFHLAGVNRPEKDEEFFEGNADLTQEICKVVRDSGRNVPIVFTSSVQAELLNVYGRSKLQAELHLLNLYMETGNQVYIYRLPGVFGKWCKPNYNSVVATFCHNINHDLPIQINDPAAKLDLVHIDDVITSFIKVMLEQPEDTLRVDVDPVYTTTVGELAEQLIQFKNSRENLTTETVGVGFIRVLYSTYISYLPPERFNYRLVKHEDSRGVFMEMLKTKNSGQVSFFTAHPGVTRGGHYHSVKTEKFLVIKGKAKFKFRHIVTDETYEIFVSGNNPEIVETVPGWSHNVTNVGDNELMVMLWANEIFGPDKPDTVAYQV